MKKIRPNQLVMTSVVAIASSTFATEVLAQSWRANERANCNASFMTCSGGGSGAPIGDLGGGILEFTALAAFVLFLARKPILRRFGLSRA